MSDGYLQCHSNQTNDVTDSRDLHVSKLCVSSNPNVSSFIFRLKLIYKQCTCDLATSSVLRSLPTFCGYPSISVHAPSSSNWTTSQILMSLESVLPGLST